MGRLPGNKSRAEARSLGDNVVSGTRTRRRSQERSPLPPVPLPRLCCSLLPQCCANAQAVAHLPPLLAPLRSSRTKLRRGPPYAPALRHPPACPPSDLLLCLPTMVMRHTWECQLHKSSRPCSLPSQGAHPPRPVPCLFRINQRYHGLGTRLWHTPPAAVKNRRRKAPASEIWGRAWAGTVHAMDLYLCVPPALPWTPRLGAPSLLLPPPPHSPGSHTLNSSHWALAWDAWSAGCIERRSPAWAARSAMCLRRAGGEVASTLRVTLTPRWAFSA